MRQYLANERPLKIMKNAFYFTVKALFVLKIFLKIFTVILLKSFSALKTRFTYYFFHIGEFGMYRLPHILTYSLYISSSIISTGHVNHLHIADKFL